MGGPGSGRKPREYPPDVVDLVCGMYLSGMTVAEIRRSAPSGYRVQTILERYLPSRRAAAKRDQAGDRNHMWSEAPGYKGAHLRLGSAKGQRCVDCGAAAREWSFTGKCPTPLINDRRGAYCTHAEHYEARCKKCHHNYDYRGRRPNGQWLSREEVMSHV